MFNDSEGSKQGPIILHEKVLWKPVKICEAEETLMESGMFWECGKWKKSRTIVPIRSVWSMTPYGFINSEPFCFVGTFFLLSLRCKEPKKTESSAGSWCGRAECFYWNWEGSLGMEFWKEFQQYFYNKKCAFDCTNCNVHSAIFRLTSSSSTYLPPSDYFLAARNFMLVQYVRRSATYNVLPWPGNSKVLFR